MALHDLLDWLDHWQTGPAGAGAVIAALGTVVVTMIIANRQIKASREQAGKVIYPSPEQTATTVRLDQERILREASDFTPCSKRRWRASSPRWLAPERHIRTFDDRQRVRLPKPLSFGNCITKGAFEELRAVCVRQGSPLTAELLRRRKERV